MIPIAYRSVPMRLKPREVKMSVTQLSDTKSVVHHPAVVLSNKHLLPEGAEGLDEVRELVLEVKTPDFQCEVGQSIGVLAPMHASSPEPWHLRWYSVADIPTTSATGNPCFTICVRRHIQKHPDTGIVYKGITSNYLCDLAPNEPLQITGPHGIPFEIPKENDATLILIGAGPGIAPFRAFVKYLHRHAPDWKGMVRVFYGSRTGLDVLYTNDPHQDVLQYFDQETFEALQSLSPPPNWADPIAWDMAYSERGDELLALLDSPKTYVYVAGLKAIGEHLDKMFGALTGSPSKWAQQKAALSAQERWVELLY